MRQLELFDDSQIASKRVALDLDSQHLLELYRHHRLGGGAHSRSVTREISQLRSLAHEAAGHRSTGLATLFSDIPLLAHILCEPNRPIARSTGQARLVAGQCFIRFVAPLLGRNADRDLQELDRLLPARPAPGWHSGGTLVAGSPDRRRHRSISLDWNDLDRIVQAAGNDEPSSTRDRALVALHCFTGLRPEEIVKLCWDEIVREYVPLSEGYRLGVAVQRDHRHLVLPLVHRAVVELTALASEYGRPTGSEPALVFPSRLDRHRPISYRMARYLLTRVCAQAGIPDVEASDLRAAFAFGLKAQGLSDHQVAAVLGVARVRTLDRLLRGHRALQAHRTVREVLEL